MKQAIFSAAAAALLVFSGAKAASAQGLDVTRATLKNGMQVVVVHDPLAPVATAVLNYRAGSNEQQYPGEAHALEHMMFRGTPDISQTQLFEIGQLMGGDYDADTQAELTQYFFSVPDQYLDAAMRVEADFARHLDLSAAGWSAERGAIKQEVTQDDSIAVQKLVQRTILPSIFKGTPYANDTLGTLYGFDHLINTNVLRKFYGTWYHPNNAIYVIAGNVDGPSTIRKAEQYFGNIPAGTLPAKPKIVLQPVKPASYHVTSDQPYTVVALAFRTPGLNSSDYAATQIAEAVLDNERSALFSLVATGKSLESDVEDIESHPQATATALVSIIPVSASTAAAASDLRSVLGTYRRTGLPADLILAEKQRSIAQAEFRGNSITDLAMEWSQDLAQAGQTPDEQISAIRNVTVDDVNRAFRQYFKPVIAAYAVPKNGGKVVSGAAAPAAENNVLTPSKREPLPAWAQTVFSAPQVPAQTLQPTDVTLSNGIRLIVQPMKVSNTVVVQGEILNNEAVEAPAAKLGVADMTAGLFPFGTQQYNRLQLREQLDSIAADVTAGTSFSLQVLTKNFDRGVQLLADEELHPAFPAQAFPIIKQQTVDSLSGEVSAPDRLAEVALNEALFPPQDPMRQFATPQTASAVTLDDVKSFYATAYRPDLTTIVVIGDVTPEGARAAFEKYFGSWKATGPKPDVALPPVPKNAAASKDVPDVGRVQSEVQLAQVLDLKRADPDWAQLTVANNILGGGGFGSLLMDDLRTTHSYVYDVYSGIESFRNRATFTIGYACDPQNIVPAQRLALRDLQDLSNGTVSENRLGRAKSMLMSDIPLRQQSFSGVAGGLLSYAVLDLPLDQATIDAQRELAATPQTIRGALQRWIDPSAFVRVVQGPAAK